MQPDHSLVRPKFTDFSLRLNATLIALFVGATQPSNAQNISPSLTFNYTGSAATATINTSGQYQVTLAGAVGGIDTYNPGSGGLEPDPKVLAAARC